MTMPYRIAKPGEFIFKRDSAGVETVEHGDLIFATMQGPSKIDFVDLSLGWHLLTTGHRAMTKAREAGFWSKGTPAATMSPVSVTVQVGP